MQKCIRKMFVGAALVAFCAAPALAADEADELMAGKLVIVKTGTLAKFIAKGTFDLPNVPANDPTVEGATLLLKDLGPPVQSNTYTLGSGNWTALGNPAGSKGFKYKGAGTPTDPCKVVLVKGKIVKAVCKGSGVTVTTPFTGQAAINLKVGTDSKHYCARFGGTEIKNNATLMKRMDAPVPGTCSSPSGAFLAAASLF